MKKVTCLLLLATSTTSTIPALAYISGKDSINPTPIYCPQEITGDQNGFHFSGDTRYFGKIETNLSTWMDNKGSHSFKSVSTSFHSSSTYGICIYEARCDYTKPNCWIRLEIKPEANLEAYYTKSSAWNFSGQSATCNASSTSSCPLTERLGFVIHNINMADGVLASINNSDISSIIISPRYAGVYEDALTGCGSVKQCTVDLLSAKHIKYGSIKIDMDTMKILQVNSLYPDKIQINKLDSYNTIEIYYGRPG